MTNATYFIWSDSASSYGFKDDEQEKSAPCTSKNGNFIAVLPTIFYYATAVVVFIMLIVFWLLLFQMYSLSVLIPVVILSFSGFLLVFVNIKIACLDPSPESTIISQVV
ncbi:hypothetical protein RB195_025765 [Necator americanus]|uniref:SSD domain-containing protein n=1 Tax=Necator americanus TaxID=51031 RepID=A0ABR1ETV5_NECAM